jgi:hypothetical protein
LVHAPHAQLPLQVCVPPEPHACAALGAHTPSPPHAPQSDQMPFRHVRNCLPQLPHGRSPAPSQASPTGAGGGGDSIGIVARVQVPHTGVPAGLAAQLVVTTTVGILAPGRG